MAKKTKKQPDDGMPPFLRRGTPEHEALCKKSEEMAKSGKGLLMVVAEDRDAPVHALAAELGFKRHQYRVEWFRDPKWLEARMEEKAKRDAEDAAKKARSDEAKAKAREERALAGGGNRQRGERAARKQRDDLPQGRIVWVGPNPKKEGSDAWQRWETLRSYDKKTVEAYCLDKHNQTTLANALAQGKVKVMGDAEIAAMPKEKPNDAGGAGASAEAGARQKKPKGKKAGGAAEPDGRNAGAAGKKAAKPGAGSKSSKVGRTSRRSVKKGKK